MHVAPALRSISFVALLVCGSTIAAQPPRRLPDPVLLKRLAESLDGNRTGTPVFIVASYDSLSPVRGVFTARPDAEALARRLGSSYDVFGPYVAARETAYWRPCQHDGVMSIAEPICPFPPILYSDIVDVTLRVRTTDGHTRDIPVGRNIDALFLSLPAVDKFMIPYYARTIGIDSAAAMRTAIVRSLPAR